MMLTQVAAVPGFASTDSGSARTGRVTSLWPVGSGALARFSIARSPEPEALLGDLRRAFAGQVRPTTWTASGMNELRAVVGEEYTVGFVRSGMGVEVLSDAHADSYFVNFGVAGSLACAARRVETTVSRSRAAVVNPGERQLLRPQDPDTEIIGVRLSRSLVVRELATLLGHVPDSSPVFELEMDLSDVHSAAPAAALWGLIDHLDSGSEAFDHPAARTSMVRTFVSVLLLTHRHSYSETLRSGAAPPRPRTVTRAMEYAEAHLDDVLTLADLAEASGCSSRTLTDAFRDQVGESPMAWVRNRRLERVRADLESGDSTVSEVACRWGFTHLGRFSSYYARRYGCLPSATLAGTA